MTDKTLEELHAEWRAARDELRAFEQRLAMLFRPYEPKGDSAKPSQSDQLEQALT